LFSVRRRLRHLPLPAVLLPQFLRSPSFPQSLLRPRGLVRPFRRRKQVCPGHEALYVFLASPFRDRSPFACLPLFFGRIPPGSPVISSPKTLTDHFVLVCPNSPVTLSPSAHPPVPARTPQPATDASGSAGRIGSPVFRLLHFESF